MLSTSLGSFQGPKILRVPSVSQRFNDTSGEYGTTLSEGKFRPPSEVASGQENQRGDYSGDLCLTSKTKISNVCLQFLCLMNVSIPNFTFSRAVRTNVFVRYLGRRKLRALTDFNFR